MQNAADLADSFTEDDVVDWLGEAEIAKGRPYVDLVRDLVIDDGEMRAEVPGASKR